MRLELTRRADYAIRAMLALASPDARERLSARAIAEEMSIPPRFLPQILRDLAAAGLVEAHAGRLGGYRLATSSKSISLLRIIEAVEGGPRPRTCVLRGGPCGRDGHCAVHDVFSDAQDAVTMRLARATLSDAAEAISTGRRRGGTSAARRGPAKHGPNGP